MSWQSYVDTQMIEKNLAQAAIAGHDGNIWAKVKVYVKKVFTFLGTFPNFIVEISSIRGVW